MAALTDALKKMLNGLAYAHAGEYLTPRQKQDYLKNANVSIAKEEIPAAVTTKASTRTNRRSIAMYMGSELPSAVIDYVIQTCTNLDHDLAVLTFESETTSDLLLQPYVEALDKAGINMTVNQLSGDPIKGLARYLRSHSEIAFMACKDSGYLGRSYLNGTQGKNALPVPVVVVVTQTGAAIPQTSIPSQNKGVIGAA